MELLNQETIVSARSQILAFETFWHKLRPFLINSFTKSFCSISCRAFPRQLLTQWLSGESQNIYCDLMWDLDFFLKGIRNPGTSGLLKFYLRNKHRSCTARRLISSFSLPELKSRAVRVFVSTFLFKTQHRRTSRFQLHGTVNHIGVNVNEPNVSRPPLPLRSL